MPRLAAIIDAQITKYNNAKYPDNFKQLPPITYLDTIPTVYQVHLVQTIRI